MSIAATPRPAVTSAADTAFANAVTLYKPPRGNPFSPNLYIDYAQGLLAAGNYERGIEQCQLALKVAPREIRGHVLWAECLFKLKKNDEAIEQDVLAINIDRESRLKPGQKLPPHPTLLPSAQVLLLPAAAAYSEVFKYLSAGRQFDAQDLLVALLKKYPADQDLTFLLGILWHTHVLKIEEGDKLLLKARDINPDSLHGKLAPGIVLATQSTGQQHDDIVESLCELVMQHQDDPLAWWTGALIQSNWNGIIYFNGLEQFFDLGPEIYHYQYAESLEAFRTWPLALAHRRIDVAMAEGGWTLCALGRVLGKMNQFADANAAFTLGITYNPGFANRWRDWAWMLYDSGHFEDAAAKIEQGLFIGPEDPAGLVLWGRSLEQLGKPTEAMEKFQKAIALNPNFHPALWDIVYNLEAAGKTAEALTRRRALSQ